MNTSGILKIGTSFILTIASFCTVAQNYSMVNSGRLSLFSNGWETRGIEIESESPTSNGGTVFSNYASVEITPEGAIRMTGNGWLGGSVINENGVDMMVNFVGDTLKFHTGAAPGFSWQFYVDDIDHTVTATIDTILEQEFIGITDSVKVISFATDFLGNPAPSWIDSIQVRVSKNNGLVEGFKFYEYPSFYSNPANQLRVSHHLDNLVAVNSADTTYTLIGMEIGSLTYGEGLLTVTETFDIPDTLRYTRLHNVYQYYNGGFGGDFSTYFDHYVINSDITMNASNIDAHTCFYNEWEEYTATGVEYDSSNGVIDTMTIASVFDGVWFGGRPYEFQPATSGFEVAVHLTSVTGRRILYINENLENPGSDTLINGNFEQRDAYMHRLGQIYDYVEEQTGEGISLNQELDTWLMVYYRIGEEMYADQHGSGLYQYHHDCIEQFVPEDSNVVSIQRMNFGRKIYPNPGRDLITVELEKAQEVSVFDSQGRLLETRLFVSGRNQLRLKNPGIYLLKGEDWVERIVYTD